MLGGVACRIGPRPSQAPIEVSPEESEALTSKWETALSLQTGEVKLVITEQQLTSFLAARIAEADRPLIDQPQVYLRDGSIQIYGVAELGPIQAGALLAVQPVLDSQGAVSFDVTAAELGPLPAPKALVSGLSKLLTEAFTGKLGPLATGVRITSLAIADGQVAIIGSLR